MHNMARPVWQRHPRYTLSILLIIIATLCFLNPYQISQPMLAPALSATKQDDDLPARLERAERIYNKVLQARQGLIRKFGPTPSEVTMCVTRISCVNYHSSSSSLPSRFPPNQDPWPAYTACECTYPILLTLILMQERRGLFPTSLQLPSRVGKNRRSG